MNGCPVKSSEIRSCARAQGSSIVNFGLSPLSNGNPDTTGDSGQRPGAEQRRAAALEQRRRVAVARLTLLARFARVLGLLLRARRRRRIAMAANRSFKYPSSALS